MSRTLDTKLAMDALHMAIAHRGSPLSIGAAGHVHGGDRLPWVSINGIDNFASLSAMTWQVHVYGAARAELAAWCADHEVLLHTFDWQPKYQAAGLARDAIYVLRPDTYVALADANGEPATLDRYFAERGIQIHS